MTNLPNGPWQHPWLRIRRMLRTALTTRWSAAQWRLVEPEIPKIVAEERRAGWFN
jgi:hypothetical protein